MQLRDINCFVEAASKNNNLNVILAVGVVIPDRVNLACVQFHSK